MTNISVIHFDLFYTYIFVYIIFFWPPVILHVYFERFQISAKISSHLAATLLQELQADSGNFSWYMTDSIAIFVTVFLCKH